MSGRRRRSDLLDAEPRPPALGVSTWFHHGEHEHVERALEDLHRLGVRRIRTGISWADWHAPGGRKWVDWLLARLAAEVELLPCFTFTPPSIGRVPATSAPPRHPRAFADWLDGIVAAHGTAFDWIELWNRPNAVTHWDRRHDPNGRALVDMLGDAAYWMRRRGKRPVLGGLFPFDPTWLRWFAAEDGLEWFDAVGIHAYPGTLDPVWTSVSAAAAAAAETLRDLGSTAEVWVTEAGASTVDHVEARQMRVFLDAREAPAARVYWASLEDVSVDRTTPSGFHLDEREYHCGLRRADGGSKLLHRLWSDGGVANVVEHAWLVERPARPVRTHRRTTVITGGAGFVGANLAHRLLETGKRVRLIDNLERPPVERNVRWLRELHGDRVELVLADVRDRHALSDALRGAEQVFHFAAQVAVTTSLTGPSHDFAVNAEGTLRVLEALRAMPEPPLIVFTSTNKVYGALEDLAMIEEGSRWMPRDPRIRARGIDETRPLDFHSPYGCSKGAADQYVIDYARSYGLPAVVFRMSCIYGPRQFGNEDQGWVAHFLLRALRREPITIFGDGRQVRDVLAVDDLVDAFLLATEHLDRVRGQAFNIGGGPSNTISLRELVDRIEPLCGMRPELHFAATRTGDQRYYVADTGKFRAATGWRPRIGVDEGLVRLHRWLAGCEPERARKAAS